MSYVEQTTEKASIVSRDFNLAEALAAFQVVKRIKEEILSGRIPGLVIDQALSECIEFSVPSARKR